MMMGARELGHVLRVCHVIGIVLGWAGCSRGLFLLRGVSADGWLGARCRKVHTFQSFLKDEVGDCIQ